MNCPAEVAEILLTILHPGILKVRAFGWSGDAERAAIAADHVHNLPDLIAHFAPERLDYYWSAEIPIYQERATPEEVALFRPIWDQLRPHVERLCPPAAAG